MPLRLRVILFFLLTLVLGACSIRRYQGADDQLYIGIRKIEVTDHPKHPYAEQAIAAAEERLNYAPNGSILGSSSMRFPLPLLSPSIYMHFASDSSLVGSMVRRFTAKPVWMRDVSPDLRAKVAQQTLREQGYLRATAKATIIPATADSMQAHVDYQMQLGPLYLLDSVQYFPRVYIRPGRYFYHHRLSALQKGRPFTIASLEDDRTIVRTFLREHGYYYLKNEHIGYEADTLITPQRVALRTVLSASTPPEALRQWRVGKIILRQLPEDPDAPTMLSTTDSVALTDSIALYYSGRPIVRPGALKTRIQIRPGKLYNNLKEEGTLSALNALGAFSSVEFYFTPRATFSQTTTESRSSKDSVALQRPTFTSTPDSIGTLDLMILLRKDKPWNTYLGAAFMRKSTDFIGPGVSASLERSNVFGGGEKLSASVSGSYEWQTGRNPADSYSVAINSYQLGADLSLTFPSILFPHLIDAYYKYPTSTSFKVALQGINHARYYTLRSLSFTMDYNFQPSSRWSHRITPLSLNFTQLLRTTERFDELIQANPALGLSLRNQFIPKVGYGFTYTHREDDSPHYMQLSGEVSEAGNLINASMNAFGSKYSETKQLFDVPFAQFVKAAVDLRYSYRIDRKQTLATHFATGAIYSYGNATTAPYIEQFFVGGANSLRAFTVRSLGPGSYNPTTENAYSFMDRVGELKLEANAEYRRHLFGSCYGALFLDAGNVWLLRPDNARPGAAVSEAGSVGNFLNQVAVGTGAGLRYDLSFLVVRFDVGVGLHLPYKTKRSGWYNIPHFRDALGFHLAIGYPF
ncbi:translocation and assembly module lipoprotein TamL [Porphyromonas sp.]